ncbi:hypothetical protein HCZ23_04030 [Celeribacter sp. HF31]|uniref:hypothetical protein n=1 Tax=Celeribacter sp. HF31 TaxID=2721558 RepID=UPI0014317110|nr:hypothetical protein [Celeribacter sp. HF31]NIY78636.1 hypothetical protein [Celeribacter sp. HF31]
MKYFELSAADISELGDDDLRELIGRLCEAELLQQELPTSGVLWGGAQEAADGGLDVSVTAVDGLKAPDFVPKADTGFQVKKHTMGKAACAKEMLEKGTVKPIIAELARRKGAYIIVSGKDDCSDKMLKHRLEGMNEAVTSLSEKKYLLLDFYGRDRIAAWLRKHPGVSLWARSKLGKPLSGWKPHGRWAATPVSMNDELLADDHPCVFPASSSNKEPITLLLGIELVRNMLRSGGSATRITGLSGVGKSRFAQALFEDGVGEDPLPHSNAIYADLGDDLSPTASELVTFLIANDIAAYLVLDNCPPDVHRTLQQKVTSSGTKLRLLSIEYDISDDRPEETEVIHLEPASEETVSKLVQRRLPDLGRINCDKVAEFSGGNARVALALASRVEADETLANFSDQQLFQRLFSQRKGASDSLLESAEILSLVYSFNTSEAEFNDELSALGRIANIDRAELHRHQAELLRRQIAQKRGEWRAVLPHALANRLARRALENLTVSQINAELFKPGNERILKSCAHRVGYLHDCEAARGLAESWLSAGAPLHDVSSCSSDQLACLSYIAPVFPETVLSALESASAQPGFASRENPSFTKIVRLLCQLAYDDSTFGRAADLVLRFAETEGAGERNNSIVGQMKHLFSLYLSGTEASPSRRQAFVARLFSSPNPRHLEIAVELLNSALEASHWSSFATFGFGARRRGTGWRPTTHGEKLDWYEGYIAILEQALQSNERSQVDAARMAIANKFRGLWAFAGCFDALERIVRDHAKGGIWPDLWIAIKNTIHFDGETHDPALLDRLEALERLAAPSDPMSEMEAYVLSSTWEHAEVKGGNYSEAVKGVNEKIIKLGELACNDPTYIERLGDRLWEKHVDAIWTFGRGLARGSQNKVETFEFLVGLVDGFSLARVNPVVLSGFIREVHEDSPVLARKLQEAVLENAKLKEHFVYLLCAAPLEPWGIKRLIELACDKELEAWTFAHISFGRVHEAICDDDLTELIEAIAKLPNGIAAALQILEMRFFIERDSAYLPNEKILSAGRHVIKSLAGKEKDEVRQLKSHGLGRVCNYCLGEGAPISEVSEIAELVFDGIENFRLYSFELGDLISPLVKNFPELVLDCVLVGGDSEKLRSYMVFRDRSYGLDEPSLNEASIDRLLAWCGGDQEKLGKLATLVCPYSTLEGGGAPLENPSKVKLSDHMMAILDASDNKTEVVETIFSRTWPSGWSGSLADILEVRGRALASLSDYPSPDVKMLVTEKLKEIEQAVLKNRAKEADEHSSREQRFE